MRDSNQLPPSAANAAPEKQHAVLLYPLGDTRLGDPNVGDIRFGDANRGDAGSAVPTGWCALDARGLLRVEGQDAEAFLQGQLTQDMARVRAGAVLLAAHCTPKGRITTLFRCWHDESGFLLDCPASMVAAAQRRLGMYLLRSAARLTAVAAEYSRIGVCGRATADFLIAAGVTLPAEPGITVRTGTVHCTALAGERWLILCDRATGARLHTALRAERAADEHAWAMASLLAGDPEVLPATSEQFIPQMLNLDVLDGVSFRKGCYTGQEIVARTHYLGRVKRRMQCFRYRAATPPEATTPLVLEAGVQAAGSAGGDASQAVANTSAQLVMALQDSPHGGVLLAVLAASPAEATEAATLPPSVS